MQISQFLHCHFTIRNALFQLFFILITYRITITMFADYKWITPFTTSANVHSTRWNTMFMLIEYCHSCLQ